MSNNAESLFYKGCDFAKNNEFEKAIPFFEQAAELGHEGAIASLATMYIDGRGIEQNYDKGLKFLQKGVNNGDAYLINYLGTLYLEGNVVPRDYDQAFTSFLIAVEKGYYYALLNLAECYELGYGTEVDLNEAINCYVELLNYDCDDEIKNIALSEFSIKLKISV